MISSLILISKLKMPEISKSNKILRIYTYTDISHRQEVLVAMTVKLGCRRLDTNKDIPNWVDVRQRIKKGQKVNLITA